MKLRKMNSGWIYALSFVFIILYSFRHVSLGVDLWDGGYNYGNFRYNGLEYMDSMWYFATWLANAAGRALTWLPWGRTMLGLNIYTCLLVGAIAAFSYDFCVRRLRIPAWLSFAGEITALSLCWAPSGALYNYLTYALLLAGTLCLYQGLVTGRSRYLTLAGAALGLNIGVRFSNLVQAALILAVWYYALISKKKLSEAVRETGLCMLGYFGAYSVFLLFIGVRYGLNEYGEGILRLFAMTEHASDYTASSMLASMGKAYYNATYWLKRYGLVVVCAAVICVLLPEKRRRMKQVIAFLAGGGLLLWLWKLGYCYRDYTVYSSIYEPCIVIFIFAILLSLLKMSERKSEAKEKLLAVIMILTILLTSLGSNNAVYSSINNMFLVMPCFLWMTYDFFKGRREAVFLPFKGALAVGILLLGFQTLQFGRTFVYEEASGARDLSREVVGIPALQGMHTGAVKAEMLESLYGYLQENSLNQKECILYGNIPGIAFYMELAPAINIWSDLRSYGLDIMMADMELLEQELKDGADRPVIILEAAYAAYADTGEGEGLFDAESTKEKLLLIWSFMERNEYTRTFSNGKYTVYE